MQSEGKTRTYIVTVAEQAQEQPIAQTDQKSGIGKCDKSFSGLMETQQEPCKSDKPKITMAETMNITLMVATLALSVQTTVIAIIGLNDKAVGQYRIVLVGFLVAMVLIMVACAIFFLDIMKNSFTKKKK